ncbi:MAG: hypothetical protein JNL72_06555 [Flavipsychrobacter sp.]|nr:hypothetical protein [Flavipsychrobacter sp.]
MKRLLTLLMLVPFTSGAQLLELGINGGLLPVANYKAVGQPPASWELTKESASSYSYGGRIALNFRKIQIGIAAEYQSVTQKSTAKSTAGAQVPFLFTGLENKVADGFLATYLFLNRGWQLPRGYLYLGISGGYGMMEMSSYQAGVDMANKPVLAETMAEAKGYVAGGQAGYVLGIARRLGISFEVACRYAALKSEYAKQSTTYNSAEYDNTLLYMPVLIGLRYQIGRGCSTY